MFAQLSEPRKKRRRPIDSEETPFPVPIADITGKPASNQRWFYYNAVLKDGIVYVTQEGDIHFLYKMGFFGKGMLSRGKPQHKRFISSFQGINRKNLPPQERRFQQQRFQTIRKQRYERHLAWYRHLIEQKQTQANSENKIDETDDNPAEEQNEMIDDDENELKYFTQADSTSSLSSSSEDDDDDNRLNDIKVEENESDIHKVLKCDAAAVKIMQCKQNNLDELNEDNPINESIKVSPLNVTSTGEQSDQLLTCSHDLTESHTSSISSEVKAEQKTECGKLPKEKQELGKLAKKRTSNRNKEDPYKVYEYLQLSLEEAFFLSYGLGCLVVKNENEELMNLTDMWREFSRQQPKFLSNYIAYHYYRSKGWVPKLGVKFGAQFILYKKGPPFYHASYSVIVKMVDEKLLRSTNDTQERWSRLAGLNRVTETVAKEVLFCYVIKPSNLTDEDLMSPKCIGSFTVHEVVMKRIVPSRERTNPQLPPEIS